MVEDALKIPEAEKGTLPAPIPETPFLPKPHRKAKGPNPLSVKKKQSRQPLPLKGTSQEHYIEKESTGQKRTRDEGDGVGDNDDTGPKTKKRRRRKPQQDTTVAISVEAA